MPYTGPTAPPPPPLPIHSTGRPGHRRSYTTGSGPFASLGALPRRRSTQKTLFSLSNDDDDDNSPNDSHDDDDDDVLHNIPPALKLKPNNSFRLSVSNTLDDSPLPLRAKPTAGVPFPRSSPLSAPTSPTTTNQPPAPRPNVTRTTSTPILLANGKPLKSSLKSSSSSPHIPLSPLEIQPQQPCHLRAQSAPSTPNIGHPVHKNVHFPADGEGGLATIRVFNRSAKPASLSRSGGDDTETETEGELSGSNSNSSTFIRGPSAVLPFPRSPLSQQSPATRHEIDPAVSSPIPAVDASSHANVYLESLTYLSSLPGSSTTPGLSGTLLVRNIAYEKQLAVRFTLDDWQTTSEVSAKHLTSLSNLPLTFLEKRQLTYGDIIALPPSTLFPTDSTATTVTDPPQWDRFTFQIKLEDYALGGLSKRIMWLVVRYTTGTGVESWDNNCGRNYKIGFREKSSSSYSSPLMQKRGRVFAVSSPASFAPATTTSITTTTQPQHAQMVAQTTLLRLKKLNLRNYAAPAALPAMGEASGGQTSNIGRSGVEGMTIEGGFPAHIGLPYGSKNEEAMGGEAMMERNRGRERARAGEESETESEESIITPTSTGIRSRTPSPPGARESTDPSFKTAVPFLTFSPSSPSVSPAALGGSSSPQIRMQDTLSSTTSYLDIRSPTRTPALSPLDMGTSPPFSMMADLGLGALRSESRSTTGSSTPTNKPITKGESEKKEDGDHGSVYWPWGMNTKEEERKVLLEGIREKSTSSPVRRVSPSGTPIAGRSSPLKHSADEDGRDAGGKAEEGNKNQMDVVSPQPRTPAKQDWSRVGSRWNKSPSPPLPPSTAGTTNHPRASPILLNTTIAAADEPTSTPPNKSPSPSTSNTQDSVYQAFVRQWCFAQGPSHPVHGSALHPASARHNNHVHGHGKRKEGEGGVGGGQLVV